MLRHIQIATAGMAAGASLIRLLLALSMGLNTGAIISSAISFVCFGALTILSIINN